MRRLGYYILGLLFAMVLIVFSLKKQIVEGLLFGVILFTVLAASLYNDIRTYGS